MREFQACIWFMVFWLITCFLSMRNRLEMKEYSPLLNLSLPLFQQVLKTSDYWMHLSIPSYSSPVRHWILQQNSPLPSKHNNKIPQHWRTEVLFHLPLRSLLKSWSLRISPSSLFLMAFSRASRLEDDFSRFLYASETCWISVSSCSGSENKHLLFFTNKFNCLRQEITLSPVFFIEGKLHLH